MEDQKKGMIVVVSGFSGAGKGTIMKHLLNAHPKDYSLSISATTRPKRPGEEEGREYFFKSREEFDRMISENAFMEYATFNGNSYGTVASYVESITKEGRDVLLEIEVQGALNIKKLYPQALLLFVIAPTATELKNRLVGRGTEDEGTIINRMSISVKEAEIMDRYDYIIVNDTVSKASDRIHNIIRSEHYSVKRNMEMIAGMKEELKEFAKIREE